ncbi:MAG: glycoside hydrolase family 25 protein [Alphaproteobacteria bacterium]
MNAKALYARGVDVSYWQRAITWPAVLATGVTFAFLRVSDGLTADRWFERNWREAGNLGLLRGAYHLLRPERDGQAKLVATLLAGAPLELGLYADLEIVGLNGPRVQRFLDAMDDRRGCVTHIYSRASFLGPMGAVPWREGRHLWIADPRHSWPVLPAGWLEWEFWQFGQSEIDFRTVDLNLYHGTAEDLNARYGGGGG